MERLSENFAVGPWAYQILITRIKLHLSASLLAYYLDQWVQPSVCNILRSIGALVCLSDEVMWEVRL